MAWVTKFISGDGKLLWRGYATRLDGDKIEVVPDSVLSSRSTTLQPARLIGFGLGEVTE